MKSMLQSLADTINGSVSLFDLSLKSIDSHAIARDFASRTVFTIQVCLY